VRLDRAARREALNRHQRRAAFRRGAHAGVLADGQHAGDHLAIGHGERGTAAVTNRAQDQEVADGPRHAKAVGDR